MPSTARIETLAIEERNGLRLSLVKRATKDIGSVIQKPESPELIVGVKIEAGQVHPDDRGFFTELFRLGTTPMTRELAGHTTLQASAAVSYPGIIKALHYHFAQTDYWAPVYGMFQVVLCDLREGSRSHGRVNTLYIGALRPWRLKIPPGVGHGYKVIGNQPAVLVYLTDRFYDSKDEGRVEYNHPYLNYDWELQHK